MAVTLKQLALELGLDYSTVSYALSGKGSINEATRLRVQEAAQRMGYVPNGLARRMRAGKTHCLGMVMSDTILVYNEIIQQMYHAALERGYELQIALTEFEAPAEERAVRSLLEQQVDGLIVHCAAEEWSWLPPTASLRRAASQGVPTVLYSRHLDGSPFRSVVLPEARKNYGAVRHLLELGHTSLAQLMPVGEPLYKAHRSAVRGALKAVEEAGLPEEALRVVMLQAPDEDPDSVPHFRSYLNEIIPRRAISKGRYLLRRALETEPRPTAVVCYNEVIAIGAIQEAQAQGLRIPDDLALICTNRSLIAELSPVSLSTCDFPAVEAVNTTLDLLMDAMQGKAPEGECRAVEPELLVGQSTVAQPPKVVQGETVLRRPREILDLVTVSGP